MTGTSVSSSFACPNGAEVSHETGERGQVDVNGVFGWIAILLNPVDVELVMQVATAGEAMPQKSTDFFPKLMSGITMYRIEE